MPPKDVLETVRLMRANRKSSAEIAEYLQLRGYSSETEVRAHMAREAKAERSQDITLNNLGRAAAQGATLGLAGELGGVDVEAAKQFAGANKGANFAAELVGGLIPGALTGGLGEYLAAARGLTGVARVGAAGGIAGATEGGLRGFINGADGERLSAAGAQAMIGGAAGTVLPGAARMVGRYVSPNLRAQDRLREALKLSGGADAVREFGVRAQRAGRGNLVTLADASPWLRLELDDAVNVNPGARGDAMKLFSSRRANRPTRILDDLRGEVGSPLPSFDVENAALKEATQNWANQAYGTLKANADLVSFDDALSSILTRPEVKRAYRDARETPLIGGAAQPLQLTIGQLHQTKKTLRGWAGEAWTRGNAEKGTELRKAADDLEAEIVRRSPEYADITAEYRQRMDVTRAFEQGADWWNTNDVRAVRTAFNALRRIPDRQARAEAIELARRGLAAEWVKQLNAIKPGQTEAINAMLERSTVMDNKLRIVFGNKRTMQRYLDDVQIEMDMARTDNTLGNSMTSFRGNNAEIMPDGVGNSLARGDIGGAAVSAATKMGGSGMKQASARMRATPLMRQGVPAMMEEVGRLTQPSTVRGAGVAGAMSGTLLDYLMRGN